MRPQLMSPRIQSKQLKNIPLLDLNSYKIDTNSLTKKAQQIDLLKTELETQINKYKRAQMMYQQEMSQLTDENMNLRSQIRQLQTELNKLKSQPVQNDKTSNLNSLQIMKSKISSMQKEIIVFQEHLKEKNEQIAELEEYKNMYEIEVQNKNNITKFYENKFTILQKEKALLISKYEQKILQISSSPSNNGTIITVNPNLSGIKSIPYPQQIKHPNQSKKLIDDDSFHKLIRQVFTNLRRKNIKSQNLKNFGTIRNFLSISNPLPSQVIQLFKAFPFSPIQLDRHQMDNCVEKMKKHLQRNYSKWSGNLVIQLLIDKIEDFEIAYSVNSQDEGEIVVGLSNNQDE